MNENVETSPAAVPERPVVLVADDEPSMLELVSQHLKTMHQPTLEVVEASDGEQAWKLAQEYLPDLVVLDVMMPGMSGWEVCRKIREDVALAHTAVVMLTGIGENLNQMTSPLYGADGYLDKPFEFEELDEKVREALAARAQQRGGIQRPKTNGVHHADEAEEETDEDEIAADAAAVAADDADEAGVEDDERGEHSGAGADRGRSGASRAPGAAEARRGEEEDRAGEEEGGGEEGDAREEEDREEGGACEEGGQPGEEEDGGEESCGEEVGEESHGEEGGAREEEDGEESGQEEVASLTVRATSNAVSRLTALLAPHARRRELAAHRRWHRAALVRERGEPQHARRVPGQRQVSQLRRYRAHRRRLAGHAPSSWRVGVGRVLK